MILDVVFIEIKIFLLKFLQATRTCDCIANALVSDITVKFTYVDERVGLGYDSTTYTITINEICSIQIL